jgi:hypothetical protein
MFTYFEHDRILQPKDVFFGSRFFSQAVAHVLANLCQTTIIVIYATQSVNFENVGK